MLSEKQIAQHNFEDEEKIRLTLENVVSENELPAILYEVKRW